MSGRTIHLKVRAADAAFASAVPLAQHSAIVEVAYLAAKPAEATGLQCSCCCAIPLVLGTRGGPIPCWQLVVVCGKVWGSVSPAKPGAVVWLGLVYAPICDAVPQ